MNTEKILRNYLDENQKVTTWPSKPSKQLVILQHLAEQFEADKFYTEKEVNELLNQHHTFEDPALLRRELFSRKFLGREEDCTKYWKI